MSTNASLKPTHIAEEENQSQAAVESGGEANHVSPRNTLNDLSAREWLPETISVWLQRGLGANHPDAKIEKEHPAPFSFTDVSRLIRFFSKQGATVLDPFVGVGSTLKACAVTGRTGIGIELSKKYVELTRQRLQEELEPQLFASTNQTVICGDSREELKSLKKNSVDFVVTSPPYWRILHKQDHKARQERTSKALDTRYSDDPRDLGNINSYKQFLQEMGAVFGECGRVLKDGKYLAVVVSDFRDKGRYYMYHSDLAGLLQQRYDFELKGITILFQRFKRVFPYGYPTSFVPNIHHQYIVILQNRKG